MIITEGEFNRWKLAELNSPEAFWSAQDGELHLLWTPIEELDLYLLNVISPAGHVFQDLSERYPPFRGSWSAIGHRISKTDGVRDIVKGICGESCIEHDSFAAQVLFNGITCWFGSAFAYPWQNDDWELLANRHASIPIAGKSREAVSRYFHRQMESFGASALLPWPDRRSVLRHNTHDDPLRCALSIPADALTASERQAVLQQISSGCADWRPGLDFHIAYALRGPDIGLTGLKAVSALEEVTAILRFRMDVLLLHGSIPALAGARGRLAGNGTGWTAFQFADLREEFYAALDRRIAGHPIIQIDPMDTT